MTWICGYFGQEAPGLLSGMAARLSHRKAIGAQRANLMLGEGQVCEIAVGIPPWWKRRSPRCDSVGQAMYGYSGAIFNLPDPMVEFIPEMRGSAVDALSTLEGAYVFAFATEREFYMSRDHAGVKAVYWTQHSQRSLFACEIKALFADPLVERSLRTAAIPEYFTFSYVPGENTMFRNIYELQPGCVLKLSRDGSEILRHFQFETLESLTDGSPAEAYGEELRGRLESSVAEACALTEEPPAVFLSGGVDSSAVLAVTAHLLPHKRIKTFSIHFGEDYANENQFVSMMVDRYNTDHTWLEVRPCDFLERIPHIFWCLDDPIGDPITVPNFLISEAASREVATVLNGEGGDPCFGGPKNIPMMLTQLYGPTDQSHDWLERECLASYRKCFQNLEDLFDPAVLRETGGVDALTAVITPFLTADKPRSFLNKLMAMNIRLKGANLILVKVDKMTSANGLLALPPLFSKSVIEFSMQCPPTHKLTGSTEKSVLKHAVADIVPSPIIERSKSGMMTPVRFWFRDEMAAYAKRVLSRKRLKRLGFFNVDYVRRLLKYDLEDAAGSRYGLKLWMLMTFVIWHERMIESSGALWEDLPTSKSIGSRLKLSRFAGGRLWKR